MAGRRRDLSKRVVGGTFFVLLLTSMLMFALYIQPVLAAGTIYIRADGSIDPPIAPIQRNGNVYTLTQNITSDADGIVIERDNITLDGSGWTAKGTGTGVRGDGRMNVTVKNMKITAFSVGISFPEGESDHIVGNYITDTHTGIYVADCHFFNISQNYLTGNEWGILVEYQSTLNNLVGNYLANNTEGISILTHDQFWVPNSNIISGNNVVGNSIGIHISASPQNTVAGNIIANNDCGIYVDSEGSNDNILYHNNFLGNTQQVSVAVFPSDQNSWDNGYPSGGNYWSDYVGVDLNNGPYQNATGFDRIGDTAYVVDQNNTDHYPLMVQYVIPEFPTFFILPLFFMATLLAVIAYRRKHAAT